ncbi:MAG: hypothetical protein KC506_01680 [Nanoarchaeota archaeon]|nr:hypothetical protein [Nanoarchaeota archaeon]
MAKDSKSKRNNCKGLAIPAFLLIGIGIGLWTGLVAAFTMIGLGVGFLVMFLSGMK